MAKIPSLFFFFSTGILLHLVTTVCIMVFFTFRLLSILRVKLKILFSASWLPLALGSENPEYHVDLEETKMPFLISKKRLVE